MKDTCHNFILPVLLIEEEKRKQRQKEKEEMVGETPIKQQHFLLVSFPVQSHINPLLHLATRLSRAGAHVTFSTSIFGHRRMFPTNPTFPLDDPNNPLLTYLPFSDGHDDGFDQTKYSGRDYMSSVKVVGYETLRAIASAAPTPKKPSVTCIVYAILLPWAAMVARDLGLHSVLFWIQPAAVFSLYHHYFHEYQSLVDSHSKDPTFEINLPGLPPFRIQDLPSFIIHQSDTDEFGFFIHTFKEMYQVLDEEAQRVEGMKTSQVLVNSFDSLEPEVLATWNGDAKLMELIPIGPLIPWEKNAFVKDIINNTEDDDKAEYMEWLDRWPRKSVVYLSFGSISSLSKRQKQEFSRALVKSNRPFLWVVRDDREGVEVEMEAEGAGMIVGWCSQVEVLSHPSVGCFVTHCGWNSTLESLAFGVPMVTFPQWTDQPTNASLVEGLWGTGVRAEANGEGVVEETELSRCLDVVMGEEERGVDIRRKAEMMKEKAGDAVKDGGSSDRNLKAFIIDH